MEFRRRNLSRTRYIFSLGHKLTLSFFMIIVAAVSAYMIFANLGSDNVSADHTPTHYNGYNDPNWTIDGMDSIDSGWSFGWSTANNIPSKGWGHANNTRDDFRFLNNYNGKDSSGKETWKWSPDNWQDLQVLWMNPSGDRAGKLNKRVKDQEPYLLLSHDGGNPSPGSYNKDKIYLDLWIEESKGHCNIRNL